MGFLQFDPVFQKLNPELLSPVEPPILIHPAEDVGPTLLITPAQEAVPSPLVNPVVGYSPSPLVHPVQDVTPRPLIHPDLGPIAPDPLSTYIGPNAQGWNDTDVGKFSWVADKMPRREISDREADFNYDNLPELMTGRGSVTKYLGEIFKHRELYKQYPHLQDILVNLSLDPNGEAGGFYQEVDEDEGLSNIEVKARNPLDAKKTLLHEIQHAIQSKEGFSKGGNLTEVKQVATLRSLQLRQELASYTRRALEFGINLEDLKNDQVVHQLASGIKFWEDIHSEPLMGYLALGGEIESRDVEARSRFTPEFLENIQPYSSQGIPLRNVISDLGDFIMPMKERESI